jgi:hypothetical protein
MSVPPVTAPAVSDATAEPVWQRAPGALLAGLAMALALWCGAPSVVDLGMGGAEAAIIEGVHAPERMYARVARWTDGLAHLEWSGQVGVEPVAVEIELAPFFGRGGDQIELTAGGRAHRHRLEDDWQTVRVPISGTADPLVVDIRSDVHHSPGDPRPLGVRLDRVTIVNGAGLAFLSRAPSLSWAILVVIGALAWTAGLWLAAAHPGARRRAYAVALTTALALSLHAGRAWLLSSSGIMILAGASTLGAVLVGMLRRADLCSRPVALAVAACCASLWLANALVTSWYFVDVLRLDAWEAVALVDQSMAGTLPLSDLWGPHNEHRPMTGRLIALAAAHLSHWNHWWEFASLQLVAALQVIVVAAYVTAQRVSWRVQPSVLVASTAMICATSHWENWLRGFSVHVLLGALGPSAALLVLSQRPANWSSIALALAAAIVGELSFGAGLLVWPIGAAVIVLRRQGAWRSHVAAWLLIGGIAVVLYVPGLHVHRDAAADAYLAGTVAGWGRIAAGLLVTLAMPVYYAPVVFESGVPVHQQMIVAAAGLAVAIGAALVVLRWRQDERRELAWLFPAALATFGLASCGLMAVGRASSGLLLMTASRYLVFAVCFWIGLLLLAGLHGESRRSLAGAAVQVLCVAAVVAALLGSAAAIPYMNGEWARVRPARAQLLRGAVGEAAAVLYPDPLKLQRMRDVLQRRRLSVFRPGAR